MNVVGFAKDKSWQQKLIFKDKNKTIIDPRSRHNAVLIISHSGKYRDVFRYDSFLDEIVVFRQPPWETEKDFRQRLLTDNDVVHVCCALELEGMAASKDVVWDAIILSAKQNKFNPAQDYINALKWDQKPRLKTWLSYYLGAEKQNPDYLASCGTMWLVAGVARIMQPGCKFDHMLILEGDQDIGKSTALRILSTFGGVEYFTDRITFSKLNDKDTMMMLQGKVIVEFSELANLNNKDFNEVKQWITLLCDEARKPWDRRPTQRPRQFILAGSTNDSSWLRDPSGGRRFWPVQCTKIDIDALIHDREQLWAEAVHLYKRGFKFYIEEKDPIKIEYKVQQALRMEEDIWTLPIMHWIGGKEFVRVDDVLKNALFLETSRHDRYQKARVCHVLRQNGFKEGFIRENGKVIRGWEKK